MPLIQKADLLRQTIHTAAVGRATVEAAKASPSVARLAGQVGLALATRSPWAVAGAVALAGALVAGTFFGDDE